MFKGGAALLWSAVHPGVMDVPVSWPSPGASASHKGHRGLFVRSCPRMLLSTDRAQRLFCTTRRHFKFLSFKWERRITFHRPGATPQITGGNKATKVLILFDGTKSRVKEHSVPQAQFSIISAQSAYKSYPLSCRHLLTRIWIAAIGLFPETRGRAGRWKWLPR